MLNLCTENVFRRWTWYLVPVIKGKQIISNEVKVSLGYLSQKNKDKTERTTKKTKTEQANPSTESFRDKGPGRAQKVCLIQVPRQSHQPPYLVK